MEIESKISTRELHVLAVGLVEANVQHWVLSCIQM